MMCSHCQELFRAFWMVLGIGDADAWRDLARAIAKARGGQDDA